MNGNRATTIVPMNKLQFLDFFRDKYENAYINGVIEQDLFVYSMVQILLRALINLDGNHSLPAYDEFNTEEYYERFNRGEYVMKLCEELNSKSVVDFKGIILSGNYEKKAEKSKRKGMEHVWATFQNMIPLAGSLADVVAPGQGIGSATNVFYMQYVAPNTKGLSFSNVAQRAADVIIKKDKNKKIEVFFDKEDFVSNFIPISENLSAMYENFAIGKATITSTANAYESSRYFLRMFKQRDKGRKAASRRIVNKLKRKFVTQNGLNRNIYQIDKKTLFSMLLFAYEYATDYFFTTFNPIV